MLTTNTKIKVYQASVLSIFLYGSETWTMYIWQERRLNSFHLRCLRRIRGITWQDRVPNTEVLDQTKTFSMHALLSQICLRWLGHVCQMQDGRIPKDIMYGELAFFFFTIETTATTELTPIFFSNHEPTFSANPAVGTDLYCNIVWQLEHLIFLHVFLCDFSNLQRMRYELFVMWKF